MTVLIENDLITVWHGSNDEFKRPWPAMAHLNRTNDSSRHANGALGVWTTVDPVMASKRQFGKYLYKGKVLAPQHQRHIISLTDLVTLSTSSLYNTREEAEAAYVLQRNKWLDAGYAIIFINECLGVMQAIITDITAIVDWQLVPQ